ncbi:hypothetical protein LOTGIDRAFT_229776 [Lottia gigantea]|uniref:Peptidase S1 domain-containing protein n=1 Tax=Lottia gigantea TaxID=225164 RepID=V3ZPG2_LOTGI|nr:hypothetical protein LOTGIDRAFT_229776 [Lottia gigantea]ESO82741.1 hypothetical protein LOTGIDRAFT_229776 [Lottia gigantea]
MKSLVVFVAVCIGCSLSFLCDEHTPSEGNECRETCDGFGMENINYGFVGCLGSNLKCCSPYPLTTTEEPTTSPTPEPIPPQQQCGLKKSMPSMSRILGGQVSNRCEWPWLVSIRGRIRETSKLTRRNDQTKHVCNGVLVDEEFVLTTAYCVGLAHVLTSSSQPDVKENILVVANEYDISQTEYDDEQYPLESVFRISDVKLHPKFTQFELGNLGHTFFSQDKNTLKDNNLALLKLNRPVELSDCVRAVCLPDLNEKPINKKDKCKIASWGNTEESLQTELPGELKEADVKVYSKEFWTEVEDIYRTRGIIDTAGPLTTYGKFENDSDRACSSDSGGMVVCLNKDRWVLEGLINIPRYIAGPDSSACEKSSVFAIVDAKEAYQWISQEIDSA